MAKKPKFKLAELGDRVKLRTKEPRPEGYLIWKEKEWCHVWWDYYSEYNIDFWKGPYQAPWICTINELEVINDI